MRSPWCVDPLRPVWTRTEDQSRRRQLDGGVPLSREHVVVRGRGPLGSEQRCAIDEARRRFETVIADHTSTWTEADRTALATLLSRFTAAPLMVTE
jgi:hypothetical protein